MAPHWVVRELLATSVSEIFARAKRCATNNFDALISKKMLAFWNPRIKCMCMVDRGIHLNACNACSHSPVSLVRTRRRQRDIAGRAPGGKRGI
jgi:hypothetical protein